VVVAKWPLEMFRFVGRSNQWIVVNYSVIFIVTVSGWCLYDLPMFDFRPYHVGANIREGMKMPEGAEQPQFVTTFILEKNGEQREFTIDDYPDSTWTFVDSKTKQIAKGYVPPIHDFSIVLVEDDEDITEQVLADTNYVFLLVSPHLEYADDSRLDLINELYEYSREKSYPFYCLTASGAKDIERWRDMTGAEYPFCATDETTLKTVIRSNPGLLLIKDATIIRKWSHNNLPVIEEAQTSLPLEELPVGQLPDDTVPGKILKLLLWFVLPLSLLVIADRTWMWTQWFRRKKTKDSINPNKKETK
jgi:triosephosphate isomerase